MGVGVGWRGREEASWGAGLRGCGEGARQAELASRACTWVCSMPCFPWVGMARRGPPPTWRR